MSANESPHTLQNGHAPSHQREQHRLSQNIPQSLMQWYHRLMTRHDEQQQAQQQQATPQQSQQYLQVFPQQHQNVLPGRPQAANQFRPVQQPFLTYHVVRRPRNSLRRGILAKLPPYLQRGTTVCCGCRMSGVSILPLFFLGSALVFIGIFVLTSGSSGMSSVLMMTGFVLVLFYVWLCRKARKEYEALPLDHPDRLYYTSPHHHVRVFDSSQLPPGAQVVHFSPAPTAYPAMHTQVVQLTPVTRTGLPPEAQMGHFPTPPDTPQRLGGSSRAPPYDSLRPYDDDDKPPAYEDLYKDI
ncbi:uncharacterized protein [Penaeus vannamei]|uniref:uncharacterized protein n=1 Tax=Penaeus vannamei TaxID=6689 RepID=UPI00387F8F3B